MKARALSLLLAATLSLVTAGCGTIADMTKGDGGQRIYGGVQQDLDLIHASNPQAAIAVGILDFPFSLVLDTAMLPITLIFAIFRAGR